MLSWGPRPKWNGRRTDQLLPFGVLDNLPVINAALPSRLALVVAPVIGLLLAYTVDQLRARPPRHRSTELVWALGFAAALLPLLPTPLLTSEREPIPAFITAGTWREYVSPGGVLTPLPLTLDVTPDGQRWQAYALAHRQGEFAHPGRLLPRPRRPGRPRPDRPGAPHLRLADGPGRADRPGPDRSPTAAPGRPWPTCTTGTSRWWSSPTGCTAPSTPVDEDAVRRTATALLGPPAAGRRRLALAGPTGLSDEAHDERLTGRSGGTRLSG